MKTMRLLFTLLFVAAAAVGFGQGIAGSAHDFSLDAWNTDGEICEVCHTPHNAHASVTVLWNRGDLTTTAFTPYPSGGTMQSTPGAPAGISLMCLSCHDGTIALEDFGGATGGTNFVTGAYLLGSDLSNDHPISMDYTTTIASNDGELFDPSTEASGLGGTIAADMLFSDKMECASCHDVHNGAGGVSLLRKSNATSALCLTCHDK